MKKKIHSWKRFPAALLTGLIIVGTVSGLSPPAVNAAEAAEAQAVPAGDLSEETAEGEKQNMEEGTDQQPVKLDRPVIRVSRHTVNTLRIS